MLVVRGFLFEALVVVAPRTRAPGKGVLWLRWSTEP